MKTRFLKFGFRLLLAYSLIVLVVRFYYAWPYVWTWPHLQYIQWVGAGGYRIVFESWLYGGPFVTFNGVWLPLTNCWGSWGSYCFTTPRIVPPGIISLTIALVCVIALLVLRAFARE
jgi:hypothetical protein